MSRPATLILAVATFALATGGVLAATRTTPVGHKPTGSAGIAKLRPVEQDPAAQRALLKRTAGYTSGCKVVEPHATEGWEVAALDAIAAVSCSPDRRTPSRLRSWVFADDKASAAFFVDGLVEFAGESGKGQCMNGGYTELYGGDGRSIGRMVCWTAADGRAHRSWEATIDDRDLVFDAESVESGPTLGRWIDEHVRHIAVGDRGFPNEVQRSLIASIEAPLDGGTAACSPIWGISPDAVDGVQCDSGDLARLGITSLRLERLPERFDANRFVDYFLAPEVNELTDGAADQGRSCKTWLYANEHWSGADGAGRYACLTWKDSAAFVASNTAKHTAIVISATDAASAWRFWRSTDLGDDE